MSGLTAAPCHDVHPAVVPLVAAHLLGVAMALTPEQHRAAMFDLCLCKITDQATNRMKTRTAKQQLADALAASAAERKPPTFPTSDDGDDSSLRTNMLT